MVFSCWCCSDSSKKLLVSCQLNQSSAFKVKFRQAKNHCTRVLEAAKLADTNETKESITFQKLGIFDFWQIVHSVLKIDLLTSSVLWSLSVLWILNLNWASEIQSIIRFFFITVYLTQKKCLQR